MTDNRPDVSLLVPVYNRREITRAFLKNLEKVSYPSLEIVIVDDGSPDGTARMIEQEFPSVRLLRTPGDFWWSKCMNLGLRDVLLRNPKYVLTLNDDVSFDPDFVDHLVAHAQAHPRTLVGSMVFHYGDPGRTWYAGGKIGWVRGELLHRTSLDDGALNWLTGMGVLIPASVFLEAGLYDEEHFPQYVADAELSMRARRCGYSLAVEPASRIWNKTDESSHVIDRRTVSVLTFFLPFRSIRSAYELKMRLVLYRRYWPVWLRPIAIAAFVLRVVRKQTIRLILSVVRRMVGMYRTRGGGSGPR